MKKKILAGTLLVLLLFTTTLPAFALPDPYTAYYPRGGMLTLSSMKDTNNTYAFKATGKADGKAVLTIDEAVADVDEAVITIQMYIVNKWGNWIAFGVPETLVLGSEPSSHEFHFTIRPNKEFCIVISAYGIDGGCVIPYRVMTR